MIRRVKFPIVSNTSYSTYDCSYCLSCIENFSMTRWIFLSTVLQEKSRLRLTFREILRHKIYDFIYSTIIFLFLLFQRKAKGSELFEKVCDYLNLLERDYFGLKYEDKYDRNNWLQLDRRISKCLKSKYLISTWYSYHENCTMSNDGE